MAAIEGTWKPWYVSEACELYDKCWIYVSISTGGAVSRHFRSRRY